MEENNAKIGKVIAIIFAVLIGIAVIFVMVVKDKEGGGSSSSSKEQVYDKNGLSFTYPANFVISTDNYENGLADVLCEVKGSDVSQIEITYASMNELGSLTYSEKREVCYTALNAMKDELRGNVIYRNCVFDPIKTGMLGDHQCYQMDFHVSVLSVTSEGEAKMVLNDDGQMLITVMLYENNDYKNTLDKIENSIKLQ